MLKGMLDKLRGKDGGSGAAPAVESEPQEEKAQAVKAAAESAAADSSADATPQAKTEVASPDHTPGLKETTQLDRKAVQELLKSKGGDAAVSTPPKKSNYDTLPETVQLDKKRVQELLRQHKAKDAQEGGEGE